jgi:deoxycytidine triphosphate deaminase
MILLAGVLQFHPVQAGRVIDTSYFFAFVHSNKHFHVPESLLTICIGKATDGRCGIASDHDSIRAGGKGIGNPVSPIPPATGPG